MFFLSNIILYLHILLAKWKSIILLSISFIVLALLAGYRTVDVGTDTENYYLYFKSYDTARQQMLEPFWVLLNKIVLSYGGDFNVLLLFASILTLLPFYVTIYKKCKYPLLAIFFYLAFYYYFYSYNIMRQCIAANFCLLAIACYDEDKKRNYWTYFYFLTGFLFHYTAVVTVFLFLFYLFIRKRSLNLNMMLILSMIIGILAGDILLKLAVLVVLPNYKEISESDTSLISTFLNLLVLNGAFYFLSKIVKEKNIWYYYFFFFILITNLIIRIPFGNRFIIYPGVALCIFMANSIDNVKLAKGYRPFVLILFVIYALSRFYRVFGSGEILPYENLLFDI